MVKDINPGSASSSPQNLTFVGNTLYFSANNGSNGRELWKSDGTAAGTVLVKDIFRKTTMAGNSSNPEELREFNGLLFFRADDSTGGIELWKSDGTAAGTALVKDLDPGPPGSAPYQLKVVGGQLFFLAYNGNYGHELWKSNGTAGGTVLVKDIYPGSTSGTTTWLWDVGTALYFGANDGVHGSELWKSDGTEAGTVMVKDLTPGPTGSEFSAIPYGNWDGTLLFSGPPHHLWKSDGTAAGTVFLADPLEDRTLMICPWVCPHDFGYLQPLNGAFYFFTNDGIHGNELWKTDGTPAGSVLVKDINPGSGGSGSHNPTSVTFNGSIFLAAAGPEGIELWSITPQTCP
jgi:ELWxxDGT repeat protein